MDDISKFSRFTRVRDPAVDAWRKVLAAGEDDVAYLAAIVEFEDAIPNTFRGLALKMKLDRVAANGVGGPRRPAHADRS